MLLHFLQSALLFGVFETARLIGRLKIVPQEAIIQAHARHLFESEFADAAVAKLRPKIQKQAAAAELPADLRQQIEAGLVKVPTGAWDHALAAIVAKLASEAKKRKR